MRLLSVNVSMGRTVPWNGKTIETGIFKEPAAGRTRVGRLNLEGDRQANLEVHGGPFKAVYAYAAGHYDWWRGELGRALPFGSFGENLTIEGLDEEGACLGDRFRVGTALLEAVQPRLPCFKLGIKFGDQGIIKRFLDSGRWGVYFRVLEEGDAAAGDAVSLESRDPARLPVYDVARLSFQSPRDPGRVRALLAHPSLPPEWRKEFAPLAQ